MPISIYAGGTGSGKSYGVMEHVLLPALKEGRQIITNMALKQEEIEREYPQHRITIATIEQMLEPGFFTAIPGGTLFCVDEAWRLWPSGQKLTAVPEEQLEFIRMHRHRVGEDGRSCEIVIISQAVGDVSTAVRRVIDYTYLSKNLQHLGMSKSYRIDVYDKAPTGDNPPEQSRIRQIFGTYKPEIYKYYKSHTQSITGVAGNEKRADGRANVLKSKLILIGLPASVLFIAGGIYYASQFFKSETHIKKPSVPMVQPAVYVQQAQSPAQVAQVNYVTPVPETPPEPQPVKKRESTKWRVAGFLIKPDNKTGQVSLQSPWSFRTVPFEQYCHFLDGDVDIQCEIDDEIITAWTGHQLGGTVSLPARVQRDSHLMSNNTSLPQQHPSAAEPRRGALIEE